MPTPRSFFNIPFLSISFSYLSISQDNVDTDGGVDTLKISTDGELSDDKIRFKYPKLHGFSSKLSEKSLTKVWNVLYREVWNYCSQDHSSWWRNCKSNQFLVVCLFVCVFVFVFVFKMQWDKKTIFTLWHDKVCTELTNGLNICYAVHPWQILTVISRYLYQRPYLKKLHFFVQNSTYSTNRKHVPQRHEVYIERCETCEGLHIACPVPNVHPRVSLV